MISQDTQDMNKDDYQSHLRTYNRFKHLAFWSCIHLALILAGLFFLTVKGWLTFGLLVMLIGLGTLGFGVMTTNKAAHKTD